MDESGHVLTQKIGPLPLVVWVAGASGVVFLFILLKGRSSANTAANNQTNQVSALAPTEAEAFGTMEQQQQDVVNALTTLGNNQSALGGSMSTLTGIVTQQGADNAASFANVLNGQQTTDQAIASGASANSQYYNSLLTNLTNYFNSLGSQIDGVNTNVNAGFAGVNQNLASGFQGVNTNINQVGANIMAQNNADVARQFADFTFLEAGPSDPRIGQWIQLSQAAKDALNQRLTAEGRPTI